MKHTGATPGFAVQRQLVDTVGDEWTSSEAQQRLLGLVAIGDEPREQVDNEVDRAAMARVFDLADVLELIDDRFDERACGATAGRRGAWLDCACACAVW
jgi:hypothetical protein